MPTDDRPRFQPTVGCQANRIRALQSHPTGGSKLTVQCLLRSWLRAAPDRLYRSTARHRHRRTQAISYRPPTQCSSRLMFRVRSPTPRCAVTHEQELVSLRTYTSVDREPTWRTHRPSASRAWSGLVRRDSAQQARLFAKSTLMSPKAQRRQCQERHRATYVVPSRLDVQAPDRYQVRVERVAAISLQVTLRDQDRCRLLHERRNGMGRQQCR
ncbi:unannotated protein [freshwater metagenome]|uniref:Unannotated protein n=1 Tax=freshwater metagenome TaxID=449393 RepID=A0A6J6MFZ1_9ZZZZ